MIISEIGTIITNTTIIEAGAAWIGAVSVITLANDTYLMVYSYSGDGEPPSTDNNYYLHKRTSSNFTSWGSSSAIILTELDISKYKNNPHLLQIASGRIFLHFDYMSAINNDVEINNIHSMYSDDNGSSWSTPVAITNYTEFGQKAKNPVKAEKNDGNITVIYQEENTVLFYDTAMDGYPSTEHFYGGQIQYDPSRQILVGTNYGKGGAGFPFENVHQIDTSNDTFIKHWDEITSPIMPIQYEMLGPSYACDTYPFYFFKKGETITVLNIETDSIWQYKEENEYPSDFNYEINRPGSFSANWWGNQFVVYRLVGSERRLYIALNRTGWQSGPDAIVIGYFNLDLEPDPVTGMYDWNEICYHEDPPDITSDDKIHGFSWIPQLENFIIYMTNGLMFLDKNGNIVKTFSHDSHPGFPTGYTTETIYINNGAAGSIYFSFDYDGDYPDRRGICRLDLAEEQCYYIEPNWFTCTGECGLRNLYDMGDDRILMSVEMLGCDKGGVAILDTDGHNWTHYSNENIPGMITSNYGDAGCGSWRNKVGSSYLSYDPVSQTIYAGYPGNHYWAGDNPMGIIIFSELGAYSILQYTTITGVDSTPTYGNFTDLSFYKFEYNPAIAIDTDGYAWFSWDHMDSVSENSLIWANTISDKQIEDYLIKNSTLQVEWEVDKPNKLIFELSHGHLFDPMNLSSIWSIYFKKGRVITLKLGEIVSSVDYLQDQGQFLVKDISLSYSKNYPKIKIVAEDIRSLWEDTHIVTSEYFSNASPVTVTENLLVDHGNLTASDFDIPSYVDSHNLYHQFIDMGLIDAVQLILDHFGYFGFVNVNNKFEPRKFNFLGSPNHTYTGTEIVEFTPDSKYATWTNRIIVTGMSNVYSEVLFELESVTKVSGTVGHWGGDKDIIVYYSEDHERICRNPRLEIIMSLKEFEVWGIGGGGGEEISSVDVNEQYLIITLEIPDFTGVIIALIIAIVALGIYCIPCDGFIIGGYCGPCIFALTTLLNILLYILGAVASYSYNIWARPIGHERATFQSQADDVDFQQELGGKIVIEVIDDPFCYSIGECYRVANQELNVAMSQRRRLKFKKTGHLMDEIGDIIRINHPYSEEIIDIFITKLKRLYKIGGEIIDDIEGWRLI